MSGRAGALCGALAVLALALVGSVAHPARGADVAPAAIDPQVANEAKQIFNARCTACHTFGKGVKVGPDLKGVTGRREREWLHKFIRGSSKLIEANDPTATTLFKQFNQTRMPDWSDLTEDQVTSVLSWFAVDGPEHMKEPDEISAELATQADVDQGRAIFTGAQRLSSGGVGCASCHGVKDPSAMVGGSLGPDLTSAYFRFQDRALRLFFKKPCFKRVPDSAAATYLTPEEIFSLKAYLRQVGLSNKANETNGKGATP